MAHVTMRELLESGVHFGHQTRRWNPKMGEYIFGDRNGIHIIDLRKTMRQAEKAYEFVREIGQKNGKILFVGTKKQARGTTREHAERCAMYYVNHRWLGGMLTNHETIKKSVRKLKKLEKMEEDGLMARLPKKEVAVLRKLQAKLDRNLCGVKEMTKPPDAVFVVDIKSEAIAINECRVLGIPTIGIADTNCDPNDVTIPIPGNDDAIRSISLFMTMIADAAAEGLNMLGKETPVELLQEVEKEESAASEEKSDGGDAVAVAPVEDSAGADEPADAAATEA